MGLSVIILAAGKGKRMQSTLPKVLHPLGGVPMLEHVVKTAQHINADAIHVVYGNGGSHVRDRLDYLPVNWVEQTQQLGTGHAVLQAMPYCADDDQVLVLYGDVPLISKKTLQHLLQSTPLNTLGLVVSVVDNPYGFGRIIRNALGHIVGIVEEKDASDLQKQLKEINTGILSVGARHLKAWLPQLKKLNRQHEYYLTDIVAMAVNDGVAVGGILAECRQEVQGVNDHWELARLERYYQSQQVKQLTQNGVTIIDPARIDVRGEVDIAHDVILDVNVILEGQINIGPHCHIGPNVYLKNVVIGENVHIKANCVISDSKIASHCVIGPFAHLRPGSELEEAARVGNFVEMKNTKLGVSSKANHLSYLGDADIGKGVNVGAGTITCNYDGVNKHKTLIGDHAFIGSNTSLIAPITVGKYAVIGAGSAVTRLVPENKLTLTRAKQVTVEGWARPAPTSADKKQKT